ncbi:uncharacterized protein [Diadema setosum]|uniref:uncharacterized protein n=1 Tax=Diadema setosum TaxID=31175 RepID=UPI003B3B5766
MTECLSDIRQWMVKNFMKLSDDKTEYLIIYSPQMRNKIVSMDFQVGDVSVSPADSVRNLGVYFDQSMRMDRHVSQVCQTAYFQLRSIAAIRPLLTRTAAESIIHSLITSRLDFCNSILAGLPSATLNRLEAVQNAAARLLTGLRKYDHITTVVAELHWLPIKNRIDFKILLLTFKAIHGLAPGCLSSLIERWQPRPCRRSSGLTLQLP